MNTRYIDDIIRSSNRSGYLRALSDILLLSKDYNLDNNFLASLILLGVNNESGSGDLSDKGHKSSSKACGFTEAL